MNLRQAAQQALEALHLIRDGATGLYGDDLTRCNSALEILSAALAEDVPETNFGSRAQLVAYISGYHKGRCIIEAVDREWLLPVGMALYRSPPKREPLTDCGDAGHNEGRCGNASCITPIKREPLTDEEIKRLYDLLPSKYTLAMFARAVERAHGIGGEE